MTRQKCVCPLCDGELSVKVTGKGDTRICPHCNEKVAVGVLTGEFLVMDLEAFVSITPPEVPPMNASELSITGESAGFLTDYLKTMVATEINKINDAVYKNRQGRHEFGTATQREYLVCKEFELKPSPEHWVKDGRGQVRIVAKDKSFLIDFRLHWGHCAYDSPGTDVESADYESHDIKPPEPITTKDATIAMTVAAGSGRVRLNPRIVDKKAKRDVKGKGGKD